MARLFPPFDPDVSPAPPRGRPRPLPQVPIRQILPSLVTLVALCSGLTAIRLAIEGRFEWAIYAILFAAVLDGIDGRVARLLRATSRFGGQLDSLTDFVNFGVAPAVLLFAWSLGDMGSLGWVASLVFAICAALRLARFNVSLDAPAKPDWQMSFFVGVPAPAGAVLVLLPIYLEFLGAPHGFWTAPVVAIYTLAIGFLMVSTLPSWSGKLIGQRIPRDYVAPLLIAFVVFAALLVSFPWVVLTIGVLAYLGALPLSWRSYQDRKREAARLAAAPVRTETLKLEPPARDGGSPRRQARVRKGGA
ncbi:MAG: CDP-diacylglycerol--serine O-phosphatidyltransferase [Bauldia sp.]|nr:CDP-diacylglycerol--serine O-phosphatidyltransferase [Bauldia sp.]